MNSLQQLAQNLASMGHVGLLIILIGAVFFGYTWIGYHVARLTWLGIRSTVRLFAG